MLIAIPNSMNNQINIHTNLKIQLSHVQQSKLTSSSGTRKKNNQHLYPVILKK